MVVKQRAVTKTTKMSLSSTLRLLILCTGVLKALAFTPLKNCGISSVSGLGDRIVGGREALAGEFPWQASLRYKILFMGPTHLCGAAILNEYWVITAAHCVHKRSKKNFSLVVGLHSQDEKSIISHSVDKIIIHERFVRETFLNDIALIRVKKPIAIGSRYVNGICLPPPGETAKGFGTASGWGATNEDGDGSSVLMAVDLPIVPDPICEDLFGSEYFSASAMMCAGFPEGGKDTCQGDSGGPLVQRINGSTAIIGIVSFGVGCARPLLPGVYTRVSNYVSWINANAK